METLKVVTLNCWGIPIPGISKMRSKRIQAIGEELSKGYYDIVVLEEIWSKGDYKRLCGHICQALPYSHYFYSGPIGSGICVFSKLPILETFFHRFHLNGQAYKVQHGDWFGGKGVGLCKLEFQGFKVNLYVTHIHAEYNRADDEYLAHRISQAFEMSQFIRLTSTQCDVVVAAGDFNLESSDVGYKLLLSNTPLYDAWENKKNIPETNKVGATCECPWNMFRDESVASVCPDGKRIDYIMFCAREGVEVGVERCYVTLGTVPGQDFPFSDHEAVAGEFSIAKSNTGEKDPQRQEEERRAYLLAARDIVAAGTTRVQGSTIRFQLQAVGLAVLLWWLSGAGTIDSLSRANPQPVPLLLGAVRVALAVAVAALVWLGLVVKRGEAQGLLATRLDLDRLLLLTTTTTTTVTAHGDVDDDDGSKPKSE
ncbi:putative neutral sphingomyelinase [Babylonia areolata]|uniref:putative neutral sphingomyelinase n=1 Tax=Babylonia areolata TaxID=304850 RepID=UPI003FCF36CC